MFLTLEILDYFFLSFAILHFLISLFFLFLKIKKEISLPIETISYLAAMSMFAVTTIEYKIILIIMLTLSFLWTTLIIWKNNLDVTTSTTTSDDSDDRFVDMVGQTGTSMATIDKNCYGKVKFERDVWTTCTVKDNDVVAVNDDVVVIKQEGNTLFIKTIQKDCK